MDWAIVALWDSTAHHKRRFRATFRCNRTEVTPTKISTTLNLCPHKREWSKNISQNQKIFFERKECVWFLSFMWSVLILKRKDLIRKSSLGKASGSSNAPLRLIQQLQKVVNVYNPVKNSILQYKTLYDSYYNIFLSSNF